MKAQKATMKRVSVKDIIEAAEKNGFTHLREDWFLQDWSAWVSGTPEPPIVAACVLGQAAINLEVSRETLTQALNSLGTTQYKDNYGALHQDYVANIIMEYNDTRSYRTARYRSYKTVLNKMKKFLAPYLDKQFDLVEHKYNVRRKE